MTDYYRYRLLAETVTRDERGDTVEGDNGFMDNDGTFVSVHNQRGQHGRKTLRDDYTFTTDAEGIRQLLRTHGEGVYDVDWQSTDEAILYLETGPVDDDTPYVRAIWVETIDTGRGNALVDHIEGMLYGH